MINIVDIYVYGDGWGVGLDIMVLPFCLHPRRGPLDVSLVPDCTARSLRQTPQTLQYPRPNSQTSELAVGGDFEEALEILLELIVLIFDSNIKIFVIVSFTLEYVNSVSDQVMESCYEKLHMSLLLTIYNMNCHFSIQKMLFCFFFILQVDNRRKLSSEYQNFYVQFSLQLLLLRTF